MDINKKRIIKNMIAIAQCNDLDLETKMTVISDIMHNHAFTPGYRAGLNEGMKIGSGYYRQRIWMDLKPKMIKANTYRFSLN